MLASSASVEQGKTDGQQGRTEGGIKHPKVLCSFEVGLTAIPWGEEATQRLNRRQEHTCIRTVQAVGAAAINKMSPFH